MSARENVSDVAQELRQGNDNCLFDPAIPHDQPSLDVVKELLQDLLRADDTSMANALLHRYASDAIFSDHDFILRLIASSTSQDTEVLETLLYKSFQVCGFNQVLVEERVDACLAVPHLRNNPKFIYFLLDTLYPFDYQSPALDRVCSHAVRHLPKNAELLISAIRFDCLEQFKILGQYVDRLIWHEVLPHCCAPDDELFFRHAHEQLKNGVHPNQGEACGTDDIQHPNEHTAQVFQQCLINAALHDNTQLIDFITEHHALWGAPQWQWVEQAWRDFPAKWFKSSPIHLNHFYQWAAAHLSSRQLDAALVDMCASKEEDGDEGRAPRKM